MLSITTMVRYMYINKADSWWYQEDVGQKKQRVLSITTMSKYMYINKADSWWYQEESLDQKNKLWVH